MVDLRSYSKLLSIFWKNSPDTLAVSFLQGRICFKMIIHKAVIQLCVRERERERVEERKIKN